MIEQIKYCFHCDEKIFPEDKRFVVGLDIPYVLLSFHMGCYKSISDINEYLWENAQKLVKLVEK